MQTKTKHIKQRKLKQNSKQAFEFLKRKNPKLEMLVKVFDLQLQTFKS
jgi:hypothetical protein